VQEGSGSPDKLTTKRVMGVSGSLKQKSPGWMPRLRLVGLTSRIIPTYRRPLATRPVARDDIDDVWLLISYQCSHWLWQRPTDYFCFTVITDVIILCEMPYTRYGSARFEVFGFVFGVVGNLNSAVVLYPVKTFFHIPSFRVRGNYKGAGEWWI